MWVNVRGDDPLASPPPPPPGWCPPEGWNIREFGGGFASDDERDVPPCRRGRRR